MAKVKGSTIIQRMQYVDHKGTPEIKQKIIAKLSPDFQTALTRKLLSVFWYPFEWYVELLVAIDAVMGKGDGALASEVGYFAGMQAGQGIYKIFFKVGSVKFILGKAETIWKLLFDTGTCESAISSDQEGKVYFRGFPNLPKVACLSLLGWCHAIVELSGGKNAQMEITHWPAPDDSTLEISGKWNP